MAIHFTVGRPHHGKSLFAAWQMQKVLLRNMRWFKKTGIRRIIWTNLPVNPVYLEKHKDWIKYWRDPLDIVKLEDVDIFWDEIARHLDARDWEALPMELKHFLQEHDKVGCDIYANTQAPMQVDVAFRRLCENMYHIRKIAGSRRPSHTKPPIRWIWGLCILQKVKPGFYSAEIDNFQYEYSFFGLPIMFLWIDRFLCAWYDTRGKIPLGKYPPLIHIQRKCPVCNKVHIGHH